MTAVTPTMRVTLVTSDVDIAVDRGARGIACTSSKGALFRAGIDTVRDTCNCHTHALPSELALIPYPNGAAL